MQLVLIAHWSRTAFEIGDIGIIVGDDQRSLKLTRITGIDAEIGTEFHGAAYPFGDIYEGAVAEHRRIKRCEEVVTIRHHRAQVFAHQIRMLLDGIADGAEYNTFLAQFLLEGGLHGH